MAAGQERVPFRGWGMLQLLERWVLAQPVLAAPPDQPHRYIVAPSVVETYLLKGFGTRSC